MVVNHCLYFITVEFQDFSDRYEGLVVFGSWLLSIDGVNNHLVQPFHRHVVQPFIYIYTPKELHFYSMLYDSLFDNFPLYVAGFEVGFRGSMPRIYDVYLYMLLTYNIIPLGVL